MWPDVQKDLTPVRRKRINRNATERNLDVALSELKSWRTSDVRILQQSTIPRQVSCSDPTHGYGKGRRAFVSELRAVSA